MNTPTSHSTDAMPLRDALRASAPLVRLGQLVQASKARFETIRPSLPASLSAHVEPGPLDADGWSLLAANGAVAAKLRQLQPLLERTLAEAGWSPSTVRIKVLGR